jgi:hypothetical protein
VQQQNENQSAQLAVEPATEKKSFDAQENWTE